MACEERSFCACVGGASSLSVWTRCVVNVLLVASVLGLATCNPGF